MFHTAGGREVRDGGGIKPDLEVRPDSLPNIAYYLTVSGLDSTEVLLDYEIDYIASHPTIAAPGEFEISDADYEEFKQRVVKSGFTYDPESERALNTLKKIVKFEGYYDDAQDRVRGTRKEAEAQHRPRPRHAQGDAQGHHLKRHRGGILQSSAASRREPWRTASSTTSR